MTASPFRVPRPQTETQKFNDLLSWKTLGREKGERWFAPDPEGRAIVRHQADPRLCCGLNKVGLACTAWGCFQSPDGRRWCHAHRVHEAERR